MHAGSDAAQTSDDQTGAVRMALRAEIASSIEGITDRDHFLQRLVRRIVDESASSGGAIYIRSLPGGDFVLRTSTLPLTEPIPPRLSVEPARARDEIHAFADDGSNLRLDVQTAPLPGHGEVFGVLVLFYWSGHEFSDEDAHTLREIAEEIAPAVAVAEHHYAVKQTSVTDLTTGAYTSWFFAQRFDEEIARAQRTGTPVTVVLVSIMDFDHVQRVLGYGTADHLLRDLATEFSGLMRVFDVVAMRSRSDFAILLPGTDIANAENVIERTRRRSSRVIERLKDDFPDLAFRVVTGAASFPDDGDRVSTIMLAAEHRLIENETILRRGADQA